MRRAFGPLLAALCALAIYPSTAVAQTAEASATSASDTKHRGLRAHGTVGYPGLMAAGLAYKAPWGTEWSVQGGFLGVWAALVGTAEASVSQDVARWGWGLAHLGLAASYVHAHFFVIDCYGPEETTCEDTIQKIWWFGPRLGVRGELYPQRPNSRFFLELNGGPMVGVCGEDCVESIPAGVAFQLRAIYDFR